MPRLLPGPNAKTTPHRGARRGALLVALLLTACTSESVMSPRPDADLVRRTSVSAPQTEVRMVGFQGRPLDPAGLMMQSNVMPPEEVACRRQLDRLGVTYRDLPRIDDGGYCGIDFPVEVTALRGNIKVKPAAKLNCAMAATFAKWVDDDLQPAVRLRYLSGLDTIYQGSAYSCRTMNNRRGARMSEHARGNAIDIMKVTLNSGREIDVRRPGLFQFRQRNTLNTVRGEACKYFTTVLGPGYDRNHKDHFHLDLMHRKSGHRVCK